VDFGLRGPALRYLFYSPHLLNFDLTILSHFAINLLQFLVVICCILIMPYAVESVKVEDVPGLARAMMSAFHTRSTLGPPMAQYGTRRDNRWVYSKIAEESDDRKREEETPESCRDRDRRNRWIREMDYSERCGIEWLDAQVIEPTEVQAQDYEKR
jgi:hypothetical protein